jgi:hypothetical protein
VTGKRDLQASAQALASYRDQQWYRAFDHTQQQAMQAFEHSCALVGQMLLDACAEAEVRPFGVEEHRTDLAILDMLRQR